MIATAVLIMLAGRLTHLVELNISHVPCVQGVFRAVYSGSCKNPILDDRRIATGVLYERMKHITGLSFGNMWTFILGFQHTARQ